jgi:hypothetical protein
MYVTCTFSVANSDRCPLTARTQRRVIARTPYADLQLNEGFGLKAGTTMLVSFGTGTDVTGWSLTDSMNDAMAPHGTCIPGDSCSWLYTSTHGAGHSTITLHVTNGCLTTDVSKVLTIIP